MNRTVMVVEDDFRVRHLIVGYLKKEGYSIIEAQNGKEALDKFRPGKIDLIILDLMMPELDGLAVCSAIRKQSKLYIIMLTARSQEEDKLLGYDIGADDYITKPFSPKLLMAKVKVLLNRLDDSSEANNGITQFDDLTINVPSHSIVLGDTNLELSPKEFDLLVYLSKNQGILLSRESLLNAVWGYDYDGDLRTVDTHVKRVRQKLGDRSEFISTIRGAGYKFEVKK
jgi:DNA-binding response OmpR family regulator